MTRSGHPTDEELSLSHAGMLPPEAAQRVKIHMSTCTRCREIVEEAARGLAILSSASEPPADLLKHVRARRWAVKGDLTVIGLPFEDADPIAEVSGRDREADESAKEKSDEPDTESDR